MLSARDNPFSTDRVLRQRYRLTEAAWKRLLEKLSFHCGRGALVGPKGSGKTTLLEDLARRLAHPGHRVTLVRLSAEAPRLPANFNHGFFQSLGPADAVLLDGAEQLSLPAWLHFRWQTRRAGIVVVTTHRAGRLPLLHRCTTTPALLYEIVSSLGVDLDPDEAARLHARHRGNLREALRELYDRCAEKETSALFTRGSLV